MEFGKTAHKGDRSDTICIVDMAGEPTSMMDATYTDLNKFASSVDSAKEVSRNTELKGAPRNVTIGSLIEAGERFNIEAIYTSTRTDVPVPIGALVQVESLAKLDDLTNVFGLHVISELDTDENGHADVGLHFD